MNSLKQVIVSAVVKVSTDPMYANREYATSEDARADFIKALIAELFPECPECVLPSAVHASEEKDGGGAVAEPEKKKRAYKKKEKAAAPAEPETKAAAAAGAGEPVKEKKKTGPKPKVKAEGSVHIEKLNPTQQKKLKAKAEELKVDVDKKAFHDYLNALSKEEYDAKTFDDHILSFLTPKAGEDTAHTLTKCAKVEWQGHVYLVDPETKKIYRPNGDVNTHVGHVGMLEFAEMELPVA